MKRDEMKREIDKAKHLKLDILGFGLAGGIIMGLCVGLTTIAGIYGVFPDYTALCSEWLISMYGFLGYQGADWLSVLLGTAYSFIDGFIATFVFALLYNKLAG